MIITIETWNIEVLLLLLSRFSCVDSVRPHRQQPTRLPRPWDSPGKNTGVGCHFLLQCIKVKSESEVVQLLATPWNAAYQTHSSMGFSRQEYWSGLPLPSNIEATIYKVSFSRRKTNVRSKRWYLNLNQDALVSSWHLGIWKQTPHYQLIIWLNYHLNNWIF